jgi:hypothetical protein
MRGFLSALLLHKRADGAASTGKEDTAVPALMKIE